MTLQSAERHLNFQFLDFHFRSLVEVGLTIASAKALMEVQKTSKGLP